MRVNVTNGAVSAATLRGNVDIECQANASKRSETKYNLFCSIFVSLSSRVSVLEAFDPLLMGEYGSDDEEGQYISMFDCIEGRVDNSILIFSSGAGAYST